MNFKKYHVSRNLFSCNIEQGTISAEGTLRSADNRVRSDDFIIMETGEYTINALSESGTLTLFLFEYMEDGTFVSRTPADWTNIPYTFSLTGKRKMKFVFAYISENITPTMVNSIMLNSGSTPLPYEPYSSEVWHDTPHYVHKADTDTITTLPAVIYPNDTTATVGVKGNAQQNGTPTPENPVIPQGCGELETNLAIISGDSQTIENAYYKNVRISDVIEAGTYTVSYVIDEKTGNVSSSSVGFGTLNVYQKDLTNFTVANVPITITATVTLETEGCLWARFLRAGSPTDFSYSASHVRVEKGSHSYGYKIPISSGDTTTPVYLGEVETTRKIRKLVLTGEESWTLQSINSYGIANLWTRLPVNYTNAHLGLSSHLTIQTTLIANTETEGFYLASGDVLYIRINATSVSTANELKSYLAAQYAAGTPVTIWYVLAEPETAVVNEPLMRIGDYADTVSNVTIPVVTGGDTLSVGTTVQPSEVTVSYKGWHPVANVHERESGAWT